MTRIAVLADIHANHAALEAVLEDLAAQGSEVIVCLGDLVGYHAAPGQCIATMRRFADVIVAGNHDRVAGGDPDNSVNPAARFALAWTQKALTADERTFLRNLPPIAIVGNDVVAVHGCYLNPRYTTGYVTSTMLPENLDAIHAHADWPNVALCGHTHVPMVAWSEGGGIREPRAEGEVAWSKSARTVLVNPGSVGQPRDGDARAAYALVDTDARTATVRRVRYDIERVEREIVAAGLPMELVSRLREGR